MPPAIGAVAAGFLTYASGATFFGYVGITAGLLAGASSLVLSGISSLLTPKPKTPDYSSLADLNSGSITRQVRQPITARRTLYGESRVSGPYAFIGSSSSNLYLHFVLLMASHEVESIGEIWINDQSVTPDMIDGSGAVITGTYANRVVIKKYKGTQGQTAEPMLTGAFPEWTVNHRLRNIAYVYVRLQYDRNVFAGGIPNVSAWIKGKKIIDTRDGQVRWSPNPALIASDYLTDNRLGIGVPAANVDADYISASANNCDEQIATTDVSHKLVSVDTATEIITLDGDTLQFQTGDGLQLTTTGTLPGGTAAATTYFAIVYQRGTTPRIKLASSYMNALTETAINITSAGTGTITLTKAFEPRYAAGGNVDSDSEPQDALTNILSAMSGKAMYSGGMWKIQSGYYITPTIEFTEDDLAGPITMQTKVSRRDRFNRIIGTFISPLNNGQPTDYPTVKNSSYELEDGEAISKSFPLKFTQRSAMSQRIAKIEVEKARQEIVWSARFKLSAFKVQIGDVANFTLPRYGFASKPFEIVEWALTLDEDDGVPIPVIEMKMKETAATVFDWNSGEETISDPAPNTTLPEINNVLAVSGLRFDSLPVTTTGGNVVYQLILSWDAHPDAFVLNDGSFEIQYKKSTDLTYLPSFFVDGMLTTSPLAQGSINTSYDIRIRAVNNLGAPSPWQPLTGVVPGSSGGVDSTLDYGFFVGDTVGFNNDWGSFTDTVGFNNDWGGFV